MSVATDPLHVFDPATMRNMMAEQSFAIPISRLIRKRVALNKPRTPRLVAPAIVARISAVARGREPWPITMVGPAGTGKSCAALVLADSVDGRCEYMPLADLCGLLNRFMYQSADDPDLTTHYVSGFGNVWTTNGYWEHCWSAATSTVLDEIGSREKVTDQHYETLKRAIDTREGKAAVFLSNLTLQQIAKLYDDRISSRLSSGTVIEFKGTDRRLRK